MADSASRAQRAAALEEKRRKLEELKKKRALRGTAAAGRATATTGNLEEYIDGLLQQSSSGVPNTSHTASTTTVAGAAAAAIQSSSTTATSENASSASQGGEKMTGTNNLQGGDAAATAGTASGATMTPVTPPAPPPPAPKKETFTVSTQTEPWEDEETEQATEQEQQENEKGEKETTAAVVEDEEEKQEQSATQREPHLLTDEQLETAVTRPEFGTFLTTASKKVERILGNAEWNAPFLLDDTELAATADGADDENALPESVAGLVTARQVYQAGKWTASRDVTDVVWSPHSRDVFLAAYHAPSLPYSAASTSAPPNKINSSSSSSFLTPRSGELQADGLVLIWNGAMPQRPEHVLTCASPVLTVRPATNSPSVVLGGCASGQVVVWDIRAGGRYPVQTSALTSLVPPSSSSASLSKQAPQGHVHPISGMHVMDGGVSVGCRGV